MKQVWPQKVNKIVAELLSVNACISVIDNVTGGKMTDVLTNTPNHHSYFCGSVILGDYSGERPLLDLRSPLSITMSNSKLSSIISHIADYFNHWFYVEKTQYDVLIYKLKEETPSDVLNVLIGIVYNGKVQINTFSFNTTEMTVEALRDTVVDHALEMLVESLTQYPHLKFMEL